MHHDLADRHLGPETTVSENEYNDLLCPLLSAAKQSEATIVTTNPYAAMHLTRLNESPLPDSAGTWLIQRDLCFLFVCMTLLQWIGGNDDDAVTSLLLHPIGR